MISLEQVAKELGVSRAAVSHVLNGRGHKVGTATRERILAAAKRYDYQPNALVRALRTKRTHVLGVIISSVDISFFPSIVDALEIRALQRGYQILICQSHNRDELLESQAAMLRQHRVDGMALTPLHGSAPFLRRSLDAGVKLVLLDERVDGVDAPFVDVDDRAIILLASN